MTIFDFMANHPFVTCFLGACASAVGIALGEAIGGMARRNK